VPDNANRDTAQALSQENVEIARRAFEAWNRGDVDAWLESAHPEIEWSSEIARRLEGADTVYRGPQGMRRFWEEWHSVWDLTIEISEYRDLGDTVVALGYLRGRGRASGIDIEQPVAYVGEFEQRLVRRLRAYLDPAQALEAVGLPEQDAHADT
jgi:ketosteroid isomerase-like protein